MLVIELIRCDAGFGENLSRNFDSSGFDLFGACTVCMLTFDASEKDRWRVCWNWKRDMIFPSDFVPDCHEIFLSSPFTAISFEFEKMRFD